MLVFEDSQFVVSLGFFFFFFFLGGGGGGGGGQGLRILDSARLFILVFSLIEAVIRFCYPRLPIS